MGLGVVADLHGLARLVKDGDGGGGHQVGDFLGADAHAGDADGQPFRRRSGGDLNHVAVVQGNTVNLDGVAVGILDIEGLAPVEEQLNAAQLPVGNVGDGSRLTGQGKGSDLLVPQEYKILLIAGKTRGGLLEGQLRIAHLVFHIGDELILALVGGVLYPGGVVQSAPIGVGEQLFKDLLALGGGLGGLIIRQPALEPLKAKERGHKEHQDEHEIQGVEDHATQPGAFAALFRHGLGCLRPLSAGLPGWLTLPYILLTGRLLRPGRVGLRRIFPHRLAGGLLLGRGAVALGDQLGNIHRGSFIFRIEFSLIHGFPHFLTARPSRKSASFWGVPAAGNSC